MKRRPILSKRSNNGSMSQNSEKLFRGDPRRIPHSVINIFTKTVQVKIYEVTFYKDYILLSLSFGIVSAQT